MKWTAASRFRSYFSKENIFNLRNIYKSKLLKYFNKKLFQNSKLENQANPLNNILYLTETEAATIWSPLYSEFLVLK